MSQFRSLLILLLLAGVALPAPAPLPKPMKPAPPPPLFVGSWRMQWKGGTYTTRFAPDGSYQCGTEYAGTWCLDPDSGTLHVEELGQSGQVLHWGVTFTGPNEGILDDFSVWKLEPIRPLP